MVEVDGQSGGFAVVPVGLVDGEVEQDDAFGGLAGVDLGVAEQEGSVLLVSEGF